MAMKRANATWGFISMGLIVLALAIAVAFDWYVEHMKRKLTRRC